MSKEDQKIALNSITSNPTPMEATASLAAGIIMVTLSLMNASSAKAQSLPICFKTSPQSGSITAINNDLTLTLDHTHKIKLANIIPAPSLKQQDLAKHWKNRQVHIYPVSPRPDRHNRQLAHVIRYENTTPLWLQADVVKKGHAQVSVTPSTRSCFAILRKIEQQARTKQSGEWAKGEGLRVYHANNLEELNQIQQGQFVTVKGTVMAIGRSGQNTFINFSQEWRKDFTVLIKTRLLRRKTLIWPPIDKLPGKEIEVRGWLDHWNGPMLRLEVPEQLREQSP